MKDLVLIVGLGRSGTNWLLSMLDFSPLTHCRNEPNEIPDSPLKAIDCQLVDPRNDELLDSRWDEAVASASMRIGQRDQVPVVRKRHFHGTTLPLGLASLVRRHRTRRLLGRILPPFAQPEWEMPRWWGSRKRLEEAVVVLKALAVTGWVDWLVRRERDVMILHIVRHPGGFLNSWSRRYLADKDEREVERLNKERLRRIARIDETWARTFGDVDAMSAHEAELWFWRYATESVHAAGSRHRRYRLIVYEELTSRPVELCREVYADCGLPWDGTVEGRVSAASRHSKKIAAAWRDSLSPEEVALVQKVLEGGTMETWWNGEHAGSGDRQERAGSGSHRGERGATLPDQGSS